MPERKMHRFDWGHRVIAQADLYNDGSYPGRKDGELLVAKGTPGEIVQAGMHVETNTPIYLVQFSERDVVGCTDDEIASA